MTRILSILLSLLFSTAALAETADLRVAGPQPSQRPNSFDVIFAVLNNGPDVARNAVLTVDIPANVTVTKASVGAGEVIVQCDPSQRPLRCELGDVSTAMPYHYGIIEVATPIADASYTMTLSIASQTPDPNSDNNSISASWQTKIEADLGVLLQPETASVDPGGTGTFSAYVCNDVRDNRPPTVRVEVSATNGAVSSITPATGFTCTIEGAKAVCTIPELPYGCPHDPFKFAVRTSDDRRGGASLVTIRAIGDLPERTPENNESTKPLLIYRWITVSNTTDAGPGSLRGAIGDANANCSPTPCRIVFEIPAPVPAEGWFTITPATPLPSITANRVTLEGSRQTKFTGNTNPKGPEIAIDGRLAHRGIRMLTLCEGVVEGLAIGNFDEDQGLWIATSGGCGGPPERREVTDNHIGVDPTGDVPWPNLRGLRADFATTLKVSRNVIAHNRYSGIWLWRGFAWITSNLIQDNGASGIFLGPEVTWATVNDNVIRRNTQMGVALARGIPFAEMRRNLMKDNGGLGIDWGLDDVSPIDGNDHDDTSNAPLLLSARYDAASKSTTITFSLKASPLGPYFNFGSLDFFANAVPDGDGEQYIGASSTSPNDHTATVTLAGDYRGKWINATFTREHDYGARTPGDPKSEAFGPGFAILTSELSNSVLVQ